MAGLWFQSFALTAALVSSEPAVRVDVDGLALPAHERLTFAGELAGRIIDSGFPVSDRGSALVRVTGSERAVTVEALHGTKLVSQSVEAEGLVLQYAAQHIAIEALQAIFGPPTAHFPLPEGLSVEVTPRAQRLRPAAITTALELGFTLVAPARAAQVLCIEDEAKGVRLGFAASPAPCVPDRSVTDVPAAVRAVLAATLEPDAATAPAEPTPPPAPEAASTAQPPEPPKRDPPTWRGGVGLGAGVQGRLDQAEGLFVLQVDARHVRGFTLAARASLAPSRVDDLRVYDTFVTVGPGWHFRFARRFLADIGIAAGVLVHAFKTDRQSDRAVDFTAELPVGLGVALGRLVEIGVQGQLGTTIRSFEIERNSVLVWSRDRVRVGATLWVRVLFPGWSPPP